MSLLRQFHFSSLDFAIPDQADLMAFLHVMGRLIMSRVYGKSYDEGQFLSKCKKLRFKMKLGYECCKRHCSLPDLIKQALRQTIEETIELSTANLHKYINENKNYGDGAPDYFSQKNKE